MVKIYNKDGNELLEVEGDSLEAAMLGNQYLRGAQLANQNMRGCDLRDANLTEACLDGAILDEAKLDNADLSRSDAIGTSFREASLIGVKLNDCLLTNANFAGANLEEVVMNLTWANNADFSKADIRILDARDTSFRGSNFTGANLDLTTERGDLRGAVIVGGTSIVWAGSPQYGPEQVGYPKLFPDPHDFFESYYHAGPLLDSTTVWLRHDHYPTRPLDFGAVCLCGIAIGAFANIFALGIQLSLTVRWLILLFPVVLIALVHLRVVKETNAVIHDSPEAFFGAPGHGIYRTPSSMIGLYGEREFWHSDEDPGAFRRRSGYHDERFESRFLNESEEDATPCPECGKQLRTPLAKQCFHCGADWHHGER